MCAECHASGARWVIPTNGDNEYDKEFLATLQAVPAGHDMVAFEYYSRYQRPTAEPCMRFSNLPTASGKIPSPCKRNHLRVCQTDLAAVAWDVDRMVREDRRFGTIDREGTSEMADGLLAYAVKEAGWKVHHVAERCLVHHSPNPQQCAAQGGVWDDTAMWDARAFGGLCRTAKEMQELMARYPKFYQVCLFVSLFPWWVGRSFQFLNFLRPPCSNPHFHFCWGNLYLPTGRSVCPRVLYICVYVGFMSMYMSACTCVF